MELGNENASIHSESAGASGTKRLCCVLKNSSEFDREPLLTPPCTDETIIAEIESIYK